MSNSSINYSADERKRREKNVGSYEYFFSSSGSMYTNKMMSPKIWRAVLSEEFGLL